MIHIQSADSITVIVGGKPFTVANDRPQYPQLAAAIEAGDEAEIAKIATRADYLTRIVGIYGDVQVFAGHVTFQGRSVTNHVVDRILSLMDQGRDPAPYGHFLNRVMRNPDHKAIEELFGWLERCRLPIMPDGRFLAYKKVRHDFKSVHGGQVDNSPGAKPWMPRQECDTNSRNECSRGLHFCSASYLPNFSGDKTVLLAIDPADVVAFPNDYGGSKGRAWTYEVLFEIDHASAGSFFEDKDQVMFDPVAWYREQQAAQPEPEVDDFDPDPDLNWRDDDFDPLD